MSDLAMDACCLIKLRAAGCILIPPSPPEPLVPSTKVRGTTPSLARYPLDLTLHVPGIVLGEALRLDQPDPEDPTKLVSVPLDSGSLIKQGILLACKPESDEERERFVRFAAELDDGEAA